MWSIKSVDVFNRINVICKIILGNGERGTGFFCKIPFGKETIPALLTCNHFINETIIKKRETIYLSINYGY